MTPETVAAIAKVKAEQVLLDLMIKQNKAYTARLDAMIEQAKQLREEIETKHQP